MARPTRGGAGSVALMWLALLVLQLSTVTEAQVMRV